MLQITLKNSDNVRLEWNMLVMQYVEEQIGGINKLTKKYMKNNEIKVMNIFTYALLQANYDEELTYRQAIELVKFDDMEDISNFVNSELEKSDKAAQSKKAQAQKSKDKPKK